MCQKKQSRAPVPLLHLPYISTPRQIPSQADTTMLRVLSYVEEATPGKRLPLNSPPTGDSESRGLFKGFPADRVHVTAVHWAWLSRRRARVGLEMRDPHREPGARFAVGLMCWHHPPTPTPLPLLHPVQPWDARLFKFQKCVTRPGARDLREISLPFFFPF